MPDETVERHLILSEDVSELSVKTLIDAILKVNRYDDEQETRLKEYKRKPIELIVNTYGGTIYDGFALVATIQQSKTPVHTICLGKAMSMGFMIMVSGHKRFMHKLGTLMYHEVSSGVWDKLEEIKCSVERLERLMKMYDAFVLERTNIREKELEEVKNLRKDWYIGADEALKLGIIDEIL